MTQIVVKSNDKLEEEIMSTNIFSSKPDTRPVS